MTVSVTNGRKRMATLLIPVPGGTQVVRIPSGHVARGLPDSVLSVPQVQAAVRKGEFTVRREGQSAEARDRGGRA